MLAHPVCGAYRFGQTGCMKGAADSTLGAVLDLSQAVSTPMQSKVYAVLRHIPHLFFFACMSKFPVMDDIGVQPGAGQENTENVIS